MHWKLFEPGTLVEGDIWEEGIIERFSPFLEIFVRFKVKTSSQGTVSHLFGTGFKAPVELRKCEVLNKPP